MASRQFLGRACLCGFAWLLFTGMARAAEPCEPLVGSLVSADGRVELQRNQTLDWRRAALDEALCRGDTIRVGERSRAAVALVNDAVLRIDQNTTLRLIDIGERVEESSFLDLVLGAFQSFSRKPHKLEVNTPYLNATIEGTEFLVRVTANQGEVTVFEGRVAAENDFGRLVLAAGESATARAGQAPQPRTLVKPRDAVQWALYYPPVLAVLGGQTGRVPDGLPAPLAQALRLAGGGDSAGAFAALDRVSTAGRDARFHLYRAALNLSVGRVDQARADIDRALALDPDAGRGLALRAVIGVVQNAPDAALTDAGRAVELSPREAAAKIALSYAQQAKFRLEDARDTLLQAVEEQPEDALAQARLAELWLSLGHRGRARRAAERAVALAPDLERAQLVLGFAALTEFRTTTAKAAFGRAIALASSDPLPRLGLGLAKIREGDLDDGRRDLEIAVGLDSGNALLRAYLGKAYFEEKRAPLDAEQLAIAKALDPFDPTAYFYDAIRKQTENRPGAALADLQAAIERNDNRAVYRGRQQLDQDRAARGTSLARVYDDLGFHQPGVNEAAKSLALDPANASAHRFLSDSYGGLRRREIARVSEQLQAQMLQDINVNPVQPSLSETNLNIVTSGGPAEAGFNEFTPLFERNRLQFNGTAVTGNNDTFGGEAVASALYDRFSLSAGAFHYETDGWRENNAIDHDIYNVFAQAAITPELNIQAEYRRRDSEAGDLAFNFDPDDFLPVLDTTLEQDILRGGLRYSPTPSSDLLFSVMYSDRTETKDFIEGVPFPPFGTFDASTENQIDLEGYQVEAQYLYSRYFFDLTAGFALTDVDRTLESTFGLLVFPPPTTTTLESEIKHARGYAYTNVNFPRSVTWTLGVSYDDFDEEDFEVEKVNPKLGVRWDITPGLSLRGVLARAVKPALVSNRTLEPTQVAGFNQFFDDVDATESWVYGGGLEWRPLDTLILGGEVTWRNFDEPTLNLATNEFETEERDEQIHRAYLHWTPLPELALGAEFVYDRYESEKGTATEFGNLPEKVETISVPLSARYFHSSGFFAGIAGTYVDQEVERSSNSTKASGSDSFFVFDAAVGWRIPNRRGIVSLEVLNVFDEEFNYQDDSFREFSDEPSVGPYIPDRTIMGRVTFSF